MPPPAGGCRPAAGGSGGERLGRALSRDVWALGFEHRAKLLTHLRRVLVTVRSDGVLDGGGDHVLRGSDDGELTVGVALEAAAIGHDAVHRDSLLWLAPDPTPAAACPSSYGC